MDTHDDQVLMTIKRAEEWTGFSRSTLLRAVDRGEIEARKVWNRKMLVVASLRKALGLDDRTVA
jgi:hypothetical protein